MQNFATLVPQLFASERYAGLHQITEQVQSLRGTTYTDKTPVYKVFRDIAVESQAEAASGQLCSDALEIVDIVGSVDNSSEMLTASQEQMVQEGYFDAVSIVLGHVNSPEWDTKTPISKLDELKTDIEAAGDDVSNAIGSVSGRTIYALMHVNEDGDQLTLTYSMRENVEDPDDKAVFFSSLMRFNESVNELVLDVLKSSNILISEDDEEEQYVTLDVAIAENEDEFQNNQMIADLVSKASFQGNITREEISQTVQSYNCSASDYFSSALNSQYADGPRGLLSLIKSYYDEHKPSQSDPEDDYYTPKKGRGILGSIISIVGTLLILVASVIISIVIKLIGAIIQVLSVVLNLIVSVVQSLTQHSTEATVKHDSISPSYNIVLANWTGTNADPNAFPIATGVLNEFKIATLVTDYSPLTHLLIGSQGDSGVWYQGGLFGYGIENGSKGPCFGTMLTQDNAYFSWQRNGSMSQYYDKIRSDDAEHPTLVYPFSVDASDNWMAYSDWYRRLYLTYNLIHGICTNISSLAGIQEGFPLDDFNILTRSDFSNIESDDFYQFVGYNYDDLPSPAPSIWDILSQVFDHWLKLETIAYSRGFHNPITDIDVIIDFIYTSKFNHSRTGMNKQSFKNLCFMYGLCSFLTDKGVISSWPTTLGYKYTYCDIENIAPMSWSDLNSYYIGWSYWDRCIWKIFRHPTDAFPGAATFDASIDWPETTRSSLITAAVVAGVAALAAFSVKSIVSKRRKIRATTRLTQRETQYNNAQAYLKEHPDDPVAQKTFNKANRRLGRAWTKAGRAGVTSYNGFDTGASTPTSVASSSIPDSLLESSSNPNDLDVRTYFAITGKI